ncbi:hypothetical protein PVAND_009005 [Polypedilum vanderplanki]|uniref:Uncharacterized protein n=1 Tax=Polypedilum vanderplanki TaxID=319348 RepID=A0A9J6CCS8_POLVA|nr:hypothetical protein PVAND_009005 [Polypedilum vanderplanki]
MQKIIIILLTLYINFIISLTAFNVRQKRCPDDIEIFNSTQNGNENDSDYDKYGYDENNEYYEYENYEYLYDDAKNESNMENKTDEDYDGFFDIFF